MLFSYNFIYIQERLGLLISAVLGQTKDWKDKIDGGKTSNDPGLSAGCSCTQIGTLGLAPSELLS